MTHEAVLAALPNSEDGSQVPERYRAGDWLGDIHTYGLDSSRTQSRQSSQNSDQMGMGMLVTEDRTKMVIDSGITSTGKRSWQSRRGCRARVNRTVKQRISCEITILSRRYGLYGLSLQLFLS